MSKNSASRDKLPASVQSVLKQLGENFAVARVRRRESQRVWAKRLGITIPTLIRLEKGDAGISIGIFATALWLMGRHRALAEVNAPREDLGALEKDVRHALTRRVRSKLSIASRLRGQESDDA
ncbi:MAG: hypothetical protein ACKVPX_15145 [Myxococcaceae bacterium]